MWNCLRKYDRQFKLTPATGGCVVILILNIHYHYMEHVTCCQNHTLTMRIDTNIHIVVFYSFLNQSFEIYIAPLQDPYSGELPSGRKQCSAAGGGLGTDTSWESAYSRG